MNLETDLFNFVLRTEQSLTHSTRSTNIFYMNEYIYIFDTYIHIHTYIYTYIYLIFTYKE